MKVVCSSLRLLNTLEMKISQEILNNNGLRGKFNIHVLYQQEEKFNFFVSQWVG